jgi:hypothetical protein
MVVAENSAKALVPLNGVMEQGGGYGLQESVFEPVHGELLIKRRSACGKARDSVLARRIAADQRFAVEHGRVDRTEFSARTRCGRVLDCSSRAIVPVSQRREHWFIVREDMGIPAGPGGGE